MEAGYLIRVLGPIDVLTPDGPRSVGGYRVRSLLGALALGVGHVIPADQLADVVWRTGAPAHAADTLQTYVSRLRQVLGADSICRQDHSYRLVVPNSAIDALQFERLLGEALDRRNEPQRCRDLCQEALQLWRGPPFGELSDEFPFHLEAIRLDELRQVMMELRFEADLALGRHDLIVGALEASVAENPYRERLWYLLIDALTQQGRRVEAVRTCDAFRRTLGEAGLDAGTRLTAIEDHLLSG